MQRLETVTPGAKDGLVEAIALKASGFFLWVAVVVKLLTRGLRDYDTMADLRRKLSDLPEELELLYSHMLSSMSKSNRTQGSKFLQLVHTSLKLHDRFPMTLLQLSFAEEDLYGPRFGEQPSILSEEGETCRLEATDGRLGGRCCGLVEVQQPPVELEDKLTCTVRLLHRTGTEFLEDANKWKDITSWTHGDQFNSTEALLGSSVAELRAKLLPRDPRDEHAAFRAMARLLNF